MKRHWLSDFSCIDKRSAVSLIMFVAIGDEAQKIQQAVDSALDETFRRAPVLLQPPYRVEYLG